MIKLTKLECPDILRENKDQWTAELMCYFDKGKKPPESVRTRYNDPNIKSVIKKETHGKCAYCESYIGHMYPGDIEHIKPKSKSKYPHLTFEWENLTYVCWQCNHNKLDTYDEKCPPINPYVDDPGNFLVALHAYIHHIPGSERGELTEIMLALNRPELLERRLEKITALRVLLDKYANTANEMIRKSLLSQMEIDIAEDKEYSFCLKSVFEQMTKHDFLPCSEIYVD